MHTLRISLCNEAGDKTLTVFRNTEQERSTGLENELRRKAEAEVNADPFHKQYGPWKNVSSHWEL